jgi:diguanylate cyclase (GGDEF)-like protein
VLLVALAVSVCFGAIELSVRQQTEHLVSQRGATVLDGIDQQLAEQQNAKEVYAQLLADQSGVVLATAAADKIALAQTVLPEKAKLGLERIAIETSDGKTLLHLGPDIAPSVLEPLEASAFAGITRSVVTVSDEGLIVLAASPVKGPDGIVGTLVVGNTLGPAELKSIHERDGVELLLIRGGTLVSSTTLDPRVARALDANSSNLGELARLSAALAPLHFQSATKSLSDDALLVALVPTDDLDTASQQRLMLLVGGIAALMLVKLFAVLLLSRNIARPLDRFVAVTNKIVQGDYSERVMSSSIVELHQLAGAVNHLAEQVQTRVGELTHLAFHDVLSQLPNRALCLERLGAALATAPPGGLAVLFFDMDNFKFVNDSLGHDAGDRLLVAVSERLRRCIRPGDTLARHGGDEFTILLNPIGSVADALDVAERIGAELSAPFHLKEREVFVTASIGVALNGPHTAGPEDLLREADTAMYHAKTNGKARCEVFTSRMATQATERLDLETDLRRAVGRDEFRVYYQPIVQLATGGLVEFEALLRWEHPERGLVSPLSFIPLAEETGLIVPIGQWVLEQACRQARSWQLQFPGYDDLVMGVNLSACQLQQPDLLDIVKQTLGDTGLSPRCLKLEITESVAMQDAESTGETLLKLTELGVQLAIDDFGTGYSSLAYLNRFPIDVLKIDQSFVARLGDGPEHAALVRSIIALATALNLRVTGEGIETAEQRRELQLLGCQLGQGYFFSEPKAPDKLVALFGKTRSWPAREPLAAA